MRKCLPITLNYKLFSVRWSSISLIRSEVLRFYGDYLVDMDNYVGITVPLTGKRCPMRRQFKSNNSLRQLSHYKFKNTRIS
jgi:hypothetical protein